MRSQVKLLGPLPQNLPETLYILDPGFLFNL
jgi:hypothetical protein